MSEESTALLTDARTEASSNLQSSVEDSRERTCESTHRKGIVRKIVRAIRGPERLWSVIYSSLVAVIGSLMFGYSLGYASPVLLELTDGTFVNKVSQAPFDNAGVYSALFGVSQSTHLSTWRMQRSPSM